MLQLPEPHAAKLLRKRRRKKKRKRKRRWKRRKLQNLYLKNQKFTNSHLLKRDGTLKKMPSKKLTWPKM